MLSCLRRQLYGVALLAFASRALVPFGYMPAAMADGGPFVICHGGIAGAFFQRLAERYDKGHAEHRPREQDTSEHDAWEYCPIGTTGAHAALTANIDFQLPFLGDVLDSVYRSQLTYREFADAYHARAQPLI